MGISRGKKIITDGLIFCMDYANKKCYNGNGDGGTITNNLVGNHIGTLNNTVGAFDSGNGGSITFDGSDDYISTNFNEFANPPFTVEIWFKTTNDNQQAGLFSNRIGASNSYRQFGIFISNSQYGSTAGNKLVCYHGGTLGARAGNLSTTNVCDGKWHQAIVRSTTGNSYNYIYIDGVFEDQSTNATINMTENPDYKIGAMGNASSYINPFDGSIAIIRYYNRGLNGDEMLQNYNALKDRFI